jgi:hypothetical protein
MKNWNIRELKLKPPSAGWEQWTVEAETGGWGNDWTLAEAKEMAVKLLADGRGYISPY